MSIHLKILLEMVLLIEEDSSRFMDLTASKISAAAESQ
jgi:hypothetical protein